MRGNEFIKKIQRLGRERGVSVRVDTKRGKGSHQTLFYGTRFTVVRNPQDELLIGTMMAMLKQLGLTKEDFYK